MAEGKFALNALIRGLNKFPKVPLSPQREGREGRLQFLTHNSPDR